MVRLPAAAAGTIFSQLELSGVPAHTLLGSSGALVYLIYLTFGKLSPQGFPEKILLFSYQVVSDSS